MLRLSNGSVEDTIGRQFITEDNGIERISRPARGDASSRAPEDTKLEAQKARILIWLIYDRGTFQRGGEYKPCFHNGPQTRSRLAFPSAVTILNLTSS